MAQSEPQGGGRNRSAKRPAPSTTDSDRRKRRIVLGVVALLLALLVWFLWPRSGPGHLRLELTASRSWIGQYGRVELTAKVLAAKSGKPLNPDDVAYDWYASAGVVRGSGPRVTWVAPAARGQHRIMVTVRRRSGGPAVIGTVSVQVRAYRARADSGGTAARVAGKGATSDAGSGKYEILSVEFDKPEICANEDVRITIKAHDPGGQSRWIFPVVKFPGFMTKGFHTIGRMGLLASRKLQNYSGSITVDLVDGRTSKVVASRQVALKVNPCRKPHQGLWLECGPSETREDVALCKASVYGATNNPDEDFKPVRYVWTALDAKGEPTGDEVTTASKWARIPVDVRPLESLVDTYLFRARAYDKHNQYLEGRGVYLKPNNRFETAEMLGLLELIVRFDGYPRREGNQYLTRVEIKNPFAEPVLLDDVRITQTPCGSVGPNHPAPGPVGTRSAKALFGVSRLGPGESARYTWRMPVDPRRCGAKADLGGRGAESGLRAGASWVMPTTPGEQMVLSPEDGKRIAKAMRILSERRGHPVKRITAEDLRMLVREGLIEKRTGPPMGRPFQTAPPGDPPPGSPPPPRGTAP